MSPVTPSHLLLAYGICFGLMNKAEFLTELPAVGGFFSRQLECAYCTGFHCGWMVYVLEVLRSGPDPRWYVDLLTFTFTAAISCYLLDTAARWVEAHTVDPSQGS